MSPLRFGVLGAARITPRALFAPVRAVDGVEVVAIAARDPARASRVAAKWGIPRVHPDYAAVLADPDVDAVYIPLPNGLHAQWTLAAIAAGKHVLCEKPFTSNAEQAREVARAADAAPDTVVMEAFHYRYHPLMARALQLIGDGATGDGATGDGAIGDGAIGDGAIGKVTRVETELSFPLPRFSDIRYSYELAGGALMDAGCYAVHCLRTLGPGEPTVISAAAKLRSSTVDRAMTAEVRFDSGATGRVRCSMWSRRLIGVSARVQGSLGELRILNFVAPQAYHRLTVRSSGRTVRERVPGEPTYTCQLRAFAAAVRDGTPVLTPPADSVANMSVIDAIYRAAGLPLRV
jgi:predicted dehydrogenase